MNFSNEDMEYFLFNCLYRYYYNPEASKEISKIYKVCKMFKNSIDEKQEYLQSLYFIPKTNQELQIAVDEWCDNREEALLKYGNISLWITVNITDMSYLFTSKKCFNDCIKDWDTSSVTNIEGMFYNAHSFNQPLNNWDTSSVTNMKAMFNFAESFNQCLNNWNTSSVTNMCGMFNNASSFNQCLNDWDTSTVNHMQFMFNNSNMTLSPSWYNK
jgi:surface protein